MPVSFHGNPKERQQTISRHLLIEFENICDIEKSNMKMFANELMTSSSESWVLLCFCIKCISIFINMRGNFKILMKKWFKCMKFSRNVNLHRLRNKFNFFEGMRRSFGVFASTRLQPNPSFASVMEHVWRYLQKRGRLMTLTIIYDWNIKINMTLVRSDGSLYQWQFVRCSKKVKRDLSDSCIPSFHGEFFRDELNLTPRRKILHRETLQHRLRF